MGRWAEDFTFVEPAPAGDEQEVQLLGVDWAGDDVWAVGSVSAGDAVQPRIERYSRRGDGPGKAVPVPVVHRDSALHAVAMLSPSEGWAVGGAGPGAGAAFTHTLITRWDGSTWHVVPSPNPGTLTNRLDGVAARSADDVWAVGRYTGGMCGDGALVLHWDGRAWTRVPVPKVTAGGSLLLAVAVVGTTSVWVAGAGLVTDPASGKPTKKVGLVLRWDGRTWRSVARKLSPITEMTGVTALSDTNVWFAAYTELPGGLENARVEHWDGKELRSEFGDGPAILENPASGLNAITAPSDDRITAVGWLATGAAPDQQPAALLGHVTA